MRRLTILIMLFTILKSLPAFAVEDANRPPDPNELTTVSEYLRYAAHNSAALRSSFLNFRAAVNEVPQAEALPDPRFTYGYFIDEVETRIGPQRQKMSISQTFPWFGTIEARVDAASAAADAAYEDYQQRKLKLFFEVKDAFYEYAYLHHAIDLTKQNLELLEHFEEVARTKYIAATTTHPDVIRAQINLISLEDRLQSLLQLKDPITARLNAALNRPAELSLPRPQTAPFEPRSLARDAVVAEMIAKNPQLTSLEYRRLAARARVELAKKRFYPDIGVGLEWAQVGTFKSVKDPLVAMVSMNLPIWTDSYKAAENQARANMKSISARRVQATNDLVARLEQALYEFQDSRRQADLYANALTPKAEEMLEASEVAYRAGEIDFLSLIDAQRRLLQFELSYFRSVTDYRIALAEIQMLVGDDLSEQLTEQEQM